MAKKFRMEDDKEMEKKSKVGNKIKDKLKFFSLVANVILLLAIIILIVLYVTQTVPKKEYDSMISRKDSIIQEKSFNLDLLLDGQSAFYVRNKLNFFDENVVFQLEGYGKYYYTYDCVMKKTNGNEYSYWAYNIDAAKSKGLKKGGC